MNSTKNTVQNPSFVENSASMMLVMTYVALAFVLMAVGAYLAPQYMPPQMYGMPLFIVVMIMAVTSGFWSNLARPLNYIIFVLFTLIMGAAIFPLIAMAVTTTGGPEIVYKAFGATALLTLAAGAYAQTTDRDLSSIGGMLSIAIIGLIVASVLNYFWPSDMVGFWISAAGTVIFSVAIAYNIQMVRHYPAGRELDAALSLYISIYNLFTSVLQLLMSRD